MAEKAWQEAEKEVQNPMDCLPWLITKYGKEKAEQFSLSLQAYGLTGASWECRDCIFLDLDEYFEKHRQRYQEHGNE
jgi:hypothetical protein